MAWEKILATSSPDELLIMSIMEEHPRGTPQKSIME